MGNLKTGVVNKTELILTITDFYKEEQESDGMYGSERTAVPARGTEVIHSGQFAVAYNKRLKASKLCSQQIHVCCCQYVLLVLMDEDFRKNQEKELILDMLDNRLRYAFVFPNTIVHQWIWGEHPVCSFNDLMLEQSIWSEQGLEIGKMENLKTRVVNKTELVLTLAGCSEEIGLPAGGTLMFSSGKRCTNYCWDKKNCVQIHVWCCEQLLLVLKVDDFQNNKGKELVLQVLDDCFVYAFVYPISNIPLHTWIWGEPCNLSQLMVGQQIWNEKGFKRGNMKSLETRVVNNTDLQLTLMGLYKLIKWPRLFGLEEIRIPARGEKTISSGNFATALERPRYHQIEVWSGQHCLLELKKDEFQKNKGKDLIFDINDSSLRYTFVYSSAALLPSSWIQCELPLPLTLLKEKEVREVHDQECECFTTRVVNKTDFLLTLVEYVKRESVLYPRKDYYCYYGQNKIRVREGGGAKTICSGEFFKKDIAGLPYHRTYKEIHVLRGAEVLLVLNSHHFHNTQGKNLILDMPHGSLTFAFLNPTPSPNLIALITSFLSRVTYAAFE